MTLKHTIYGAMLYTCIALIFSIQAHAHGGAVELKDDECARWAGKDVVHFNVYQPQFDVRANYCGAIPKTGAAIFVVDLINQKLRETKIALKLVLRGDDGNETPILDLPGQIYKQGVIEANAVLEKAGYYKAYVTIDGSQAAQPAMGYRVAMRSQVKAPGMQFMLAGLLLAAGGVMFLLIFGDRLKSIFAKD